MLRCVCSSPVVRPVLRVTPRSSSVAILRALASMGFILYAGFMPPVLASPAAGTDSMAQHAVGGTAGVRAGEYEPAPTKLPEDLARLFAYDAALPLEIQGKILDVQDSVQIHDMSFASTRGGRVTAYMVVPVGSGPFAGIVFGHWGNGNRTEFLPEAKLYAKAGAVSIMIDYPWVRPAPWRRSLKYMAEPSADKEAYVQAVVDLRRAIDLLGSRKDVDSARIAYVGHSYGAQWGAILSAVDRRPKAYVLMGGVPDGEAIWVEGDDPDIVGARTSTPPEAFEAYMKTLAPLDAVRYVPHAAPAPLLFQFARFEQYFKTPAMERYFAAASEPKTVLWYDTGHDLNDPRALVDRAAWIRKALRLKAIPVRVK